MTRRRLLITVAAVATAAACFGLGAGVSHWTQGRQWSVLSPSSTTPRDDGVAEQRAIGLVVGMTRTSDGLTFDAWYRAREARLHPGATFSYRALLNGNDVCGFWEVYAMPVRGVVQPQTLASVDEATGAVSGEDEIGSHTSYVAMTSRCAFAARPGHTWLDQFRGGAAP